MPVGFFKKKSSDPEIPSSELVLNPDGSIYHLHLFPEQISSTIITVGDPGRVHRVTKFFDKIELEVHHREFLTQTGIYKGKRISVVSTGIGTDNVELVMNELDALINIDLKKRTLRPDFTPLKIIRIGTSGSIQEDIPLGSHLVSVKGVGMDTLMAFYQLPQTEEEKKTAHALRTQFSLNFQPYCVSASQDLLSVFGEGFIMGNTVTLPGFYAPQGRTLRCEPQYPDLINKLMYFKLGDGWLTNFEMETAGYYALGRILGHEVLSLNAIVANRVNQTFSKNPLRVIDTLIEKALSLL